MDIRLFTLCDGAYNYDGKLTIVGTVDNIKVPKVPTLASIGLAAKIRIDVNSDKKENISIIFKTASGELLIPEMSFTTELKDQIVIAGNINGLNIKELGDCFVELRVGTTLYSLPFKVVK